MSADQPELTEQVIGARRELEQMARYEPGRGAANTRRRVREVLEAVAKDDRGAAARPDITYALGWVRRLDDWDREVSAKRHLSRRTSRDIGPR